MPRDDRLRAHCERVWSRCLKEEGLELIGWRTVPVDNSCLSVMVRDVEPVQRQVFIRRPASMTDQEEFERHLYIVRKVVSNAIHDAYKGRDIGHYTVSLSTRTVVYKGMFLSYQVKAYYKDLSDPRLVSALALVHQRFSTNTFPSWKLAHPYRMVAHNGEINSCAATSTGWRHVRHPYRRRYSAIASRSSGRSPMKASPTPRASTTPSSSSSWAATAFRTLR